MTVEVLKESYRPSLMCLALIVYARRRWIRQVLHSLNLSKLITGYLMRSDFSKVRIFTQLRDANEGNVFPLFFSETKRVGLF